MKVRSVLSVAMFLIQFSHSGNGYLSPLRFLPIDPVFPPKQSPEYSCAPFSLTLDSSGSIRSVKYNNEEIIRSIQFRKILQSGSIVVKQARSEIRVSSISALLHYEGEIWRNGEKIGTFILFLEGFTGSSRVYLYNRIVSQVPQSFAFSCDVEFTEVSSAMIDTGKGFSHLQSPAQVSIDRNKSISCRTYSDRIQKNIYFTLVPGLPHIRTWDSEYFTIDSELRQIDVNAAIPGRISIDVSPLTLQEGNTFEFSAVCSVSPQTNVQGFYSTEMIRQFGWYFPIEGYSTHQMSSAKGFEFLPKNSWTWGWSTLANPMMQFVTEKSDTVIGGFFYDEKFRHLLYFLDHQTSYGLLPYALRSPTLFRQTKDTSRYFTDFLFAQAGIRDVQFAVNVFPSLPENERNVIYNRLMRIKKLFSEHDTLSWIVNLGQNGYWFEYSNLWNYEGYHPFIVNTHITALHLANILGLLSLQHNDTVNLKFWKSIVERGLKGFYWFISDSSNWKANKEGKQELVYKKESLPLNNYHNVTFSEFKEVCENLVAYEHLEKITGTLKRFGILLKNF